MDKEFEKELHRLLALHKMNITEEVNSFSREIYIDFEKMEKELKNLIKSNEKIRETHE